MREMYVDLPTPVMTPADAYNHLVKGEIERVDIEQLSGRVAATMLVPYPPGIPTIMPGERFGDSDEPIIQSLRIAVNRMRASRASSRMCTGSSSSTMAM